MSTIQIVGRSSSHFTRLALIFAHELHVPFELVPIYDMTQTGPEMYAHNPALKLPILRRGDAVVFGAQNICRKLADIAPANARIIWPEELRDDLSRNAQELVTHCMNAQVQFAFGIAINKLPADNLYFVKARAGMIGALAWLESHLSHALEKLPRRDLSFFEASLFCLIDHLRFRETVELDQYRALLRFTDEFAQRPSAQKTPYRFDVPASS
jgi:glutathione S-transferase